MASLAVFDFDRTIVNDDSDATIINRLREKNPPPEWEAGSHDWTPYMSNVCHILLEIFLGVGGGFKNLYYISSTINIFR